jgi:hypothetical protein
MRRCPDVGSRTVTGIRLIEDAPIWYAGTPYVEEIVLRRPHSRMRTCHLCGDSPVIRKGDAPDSVPAERDGLLPTVDRIVVAKRNRSNGRDGHIEAIAVIHRVKFVLRLEVAQLGIGQHDRCSDSIQIS